MTSETKPPTTQQPTTPPPVPKPPTRNPKFIHATIHTLAQFRTALITHLKQKPSPFRLVTETDRQALKAKYGDDISTQISKIVAVGDEKYAWLFGVGELMPGLKIKIRNVKLITERDVGGDYVFLDCEPDAGGLAMFMARSRGEEGE
ncbi:40S ribosomal protein [Venturia nashicola]|uniref:40S ribosomal protein n=1 Tax=Venturia nashicola TaxID=86259 RepID=A0A4Z1PNA5_9PEZI|nr:40S ribosomal protein [Venturia nashicola]TLD36656.1 40S ribosomal protein [Venturia nashicola]